MIPTILFLLLRKYRRTNPEGAARVFRAVFKTSRILFLFFLLTALPLFVMAQEQTLDYVIKRKGSEVGTLRFSQFASGNRSFLKLSSEVRTRVIFLFTARAQEEAEYENGILVASSLYRKMNGNEKANKKTRLSGNRYIVSKNNGAETLPHYPIRFTMLDLYRTEPLFVSRVYSDNFQEFLDIQKTGPHQYKIKFPDGNSNDYFYDNGSCARIKLNHSLYSVSIERIK